MAANNIKRIGDIIESVTRFVNALMKTLKNLSCCVTVRQKYTRKKLRKEANKMMKHRNRVSHINN